MQCQGTGRGDPCGLCDIFPWRQQNEIPTLQFGPGCHFTWFAAEMSLAAQAYLFGHKGSFFCFCVIHRSRKHLCFLSAMLRHRQFCEAVHGLLNQRCYRTFPFLGTCLLREIERVRLIIDICMYKQPLEQAYTIVVPEAFPGNQVPFVLVTHKNSSDLSISLGIFSGMQGIVPSFCDPGKFCSNQTSLLSFSIYHAGKYFSSIDGVQIIFTFKNLFYKNQETCLKSTLSQGTWVR